MPNTIFNLVKLLNESPETGFEMFGIVYKIFNLANGKVYIGQTTRRLEERWWEHKKATSGNILLARAMRKHGKDKFSIERIDGASSQDELNYLERFWIAHHKSTDSNHGYNLTEGGDGHVVDNSLRIRKIRHFIRCKETGEIYISVIDAANHKGVQTACINSCIKGGKSLSCRGYTWDKIDKTNFDIGSLISCKEPKFPKSAVRAKPIYPTQFQARYDAHRAKAHARHLKIVRCIETGQTWPSLRAAAKDVGCYTWLGQCICDKKQYKRRTYVYVSGGVK